MGLGWEDCAELLIRDALGNGATPNDGTLTFGLMRPFCCGGLVEGEYQSFGDALYHWHGDGVSKLPIHLRSRNTLWDLKPLWKPHDGPAF